MGSRLRPVSIRTVRSLDDVATDGALIVREGFNESFGVFVTIGRSLGLGVGVSVGLTDGLGVLVSSGLSVGIGVGVDVGLTNGFGVAVGFGRSVGVGVGFAISNT